MINTNAIVNNVPCIFIEFGSGDIMVASGKFSEEKTMVVFKNIEPVKVGTSLKGVGKNLKEVKPEVIITFSDPESIDIIMKYLRAAKKNLIELKKRATIKYYRQIKN